MLSWWLLGWKFMAENAQLQPMCECVFLFKSAAHISMYRAAVNKNYAQFKISHKHTKREREQPSEF